MLRSSVPSSSSSSTAGSGLGGIAAARRRLGDAREHGEDEGSDGKEECAGRELLSGREMVRAVMLLEESLVVVVVVCVRGSRVISGRAG